MQALEKEKNLYGEDIEVMERMDDCTVYKMRTAEGEGIMTSYEVLPGIELVYNNFQMSSCFQDIYPHGEIMEINHCKEGRFECEFKSGAYAYIEEGDLAVTMIGNQVTTSSFPLEHYRGIAVLIYLEEAAVSLSSVLQDVSIDLYALREKLCKNNKCFIMRAKAEIQHIFSQLYTVPSQVRKGYFKLKVLELLLFLSIAEVCEQGELRKYFPKKQVQIIKEIKRYMIDHIEKRFTLHELSEKFNIGLTSMKLCFKGVYGTSILAYMKDYRMRTAAFMLHQNHDSITTIAGKLGYENASKFAAAFKEIIGVCPLEYRKIPLSEWSETRPNGVEIKRVKMI